MPLRSSMSMSLLSRRTHWLTSLRARPVAVLRSLFDAGFGVRLAREIPHIRVDFENEDHNIF